MNLTQDELADAIASIENWRAGPDTLAGNLLPLIERHIAAGQQGACSHKTLAKRGEEWVCLECERRAQPPKPAGAVPLPERIGTLYQKDVCYLKDVTAYGSAREAEGAGREAVAWYAPSIDDTCTNAKKVQRERDLPETARLFTVPLYTHPSPADDAEDAARYRWLRNERVGPERPTWLERGNKLDAAIDEARRLTGGKSHA